MRLVPKRLLWVAIAVAVIGSVVSAANGEYKGFRVVHVVVNGEPVESPVPAVNFYGATMLPVRAVAEALGADVAWDGATWTATLSSKVTPEAYAALEAQLAAVRADLEGYLKAANPLASTPVSVTSESGIVLTLNGVEITRSLGEFVEADSGRVFVVVDVTIYNGSQEPFDFNPLYLRVADTQARLYNLALWGASSLGDDLKIVSLIQGERVRGRQAFELSEGTSLSQVRLSLDVFSRTELILQLR